MTANGPDPSLDAIDLARLIETRQISASELTEQAIARAEELNPTLNAIIHPLYNQARREAAGPPAQGPFAGVPFLTKDLMCATEGDPHHQGNVALRDVGHRAPHDTYLAVMFRRAGLINLGRTNTPEFGGSITTEPLAYGPSRNPWNTDHSTGGSSGGSAAAVAAGIVPMAHANDGGGSIRIPASECGLFGLKPTRGRVSQGPDSGDSWGGATIEGAVTRSVRDSATLLDAISTPWPGDPYHAPEPPQPFRSATHTDPGALRIGYTATSPWGKVDPECRIAVERTAGLLEDLGHHVDQAHPEPLFDDEFFDQFRIVVGTATAAQVASIGTILGRPMTRDDVEGDTWAFAELGRSVSGVNYLEAVEWFHTYTRRMATWWSDGFDILMTPTLAEPPPRIGELRDPRYGRQRLVDLLKFTAQFNVTGQPAMSMPLHWTPSNLPVGIQFVGRAAGEFQLLSLGAQIEQAQPWAHRRPPVFATS